MNNFRITKGTPAESAQLAAVHFQSWQETYPGLLPQAVLAENTLAQRQQQWASYWENQTPEDFLWVAQVPAAGVVGFVCGGRSRLKHPHWQGEIYALYLLAAYQGQGIGRALLSQAFEILARQGCHHNLVWVLKENPFRRFYEALGGQIILGRQIELKGALVSEIAYGWHIKAVSARAS